MLSSDAYGCFRSQTSEFPLSADFHICELCIVAGIPLGYLSVGPTPHMPSVDLPVPFDLVVTDATEGYAAQ